MGGPAPGCGRPASGHAFCSAMRICTPNWSKRASEERPALRFQGTGRGGVLARAEALGVGPAAALHRGRAHAGAADAARDRSTTATATRRSTRASRARWRRRPPACTSPRRCWTSCATAGHELAWLTLHVGPGTFRPVEVDDPREHHLDPERVRDLDRDRRGREPRARRGPPGGGGGHHRGAHAGDASARDGRGMRGRAAGATDLFILPGRRFRVVTDLVTNFHLPRSTLLMLVAAFAGREQVLARLRRGDRAPATASTATATPCCSGAAGRPRERHRSLRGAGPRRRRPGGSAARPRTGRWRRRCSCRWARRPR